MTLPYVSPNQSAILTSLRAFLLTALPPNVEVRRGQINRVAQPIGPDYVVLTPILMNRLDLNNIDLYADCAFTGSIAGNVLAVSAMQIGTIQVGNTLFGSGIPSGISVSGTLSGTGGPGTYLISGTLSAIGPETMACGVLFAMSPTEVTVQCDVYGPDSADNVQIIATLFRDYYAIQNFASDDTGPPPGWEIIAVGGTLPSPYTGIGPLYASDPRQMTQVFGEEQYELRWTIDLHMQANQIVVAPQQFLDTVHITTIEVDTTYP